MVNVIVTSRGAPRQIQRQLDPMLKRGFEETARNWFEELFPKHFTSAGGREYAYERRTRRYMLRKARKLHHQNPIEWKGDTKRTATSAARIGATSKGATVSVSVPAYIDRPRGRRNYDYARELTAVSGNDDEQLTRLLDAIVTREMVTAGSEEVRQLAN